VVPASASAREIGDLWLYVQDRLSRIVHDPALLPEITPSHLAIGSLLATGDSESEDDAPPVVAPPAYDGPERRGAADRRILLPNALYRGPERRAFGRRHTDTAWDK